jgi:hypothetical protein
MNEPAQREKVFRVPQQPETVALLPKKHYCSQISCVPDADRPLLLLLLLLSHVLQTNSWCCFCACVLPLLLLSHMLQTNLLVI